jgi:hypothetical protein
MHKCALLLNSNNVVFDTEEIACNTNFYDKKKKQNFTSLLYFPKSFIVVHTDCWKFCKKELGLLLKYSDFPFHKISPNFYFAIDVVNYKPIMNYWEQSFKVDEYLESPTKNAFLAKFIKNTISQLKIKKDRIGNYKFVIIKSLISQSEIKDLPSISATYYKNNDLLIGNDGKIWKINNKKWVKAADITSRKLFIKIPVTKKNQQLLENFYQYFNYAYFEPKLFVIKKIAKLPQLGEVSSCGIDYFI